jgi:release factor glutamine methyltransferase
VIQQDIYFLLKEKYNFNDSDPNFLKDKNKLKEGFPLAYLIGHIPFLNCHIDLSQKPLIPRPETEFLINNLIKITPRGCDFKGKILDLCCGSGCIGIALLKNLPNISVDFADISPKAINQTRINLKLNKISKSRYKLIESDLFNKIKLKYDLIITNPPYVNPQGKFDNSLKYEPKKALFAGEDGLFYIKKIISNFDKYLKLKGHLYLEFGDKQKPAIRKLVSNGKIWKPSFLKDQFEKYRFLHLTHRKDVPYT